MAEAGMVQQFARAAGSYDKASNLQQQVAIELLDRLGDNSAGLVVQNALDLGCATAWLANDLTACFPKAHFLGIDIALPMLKQAEKTGRTGKNYQAVCADGCRLPLVQSSLDLIFSSFALQWSCPLDVLAEQARVLRPGGVLAVAVPLKGSLKELRLCLEDIEGFGKVNDLPDKTKWLTAAEQVGLKVFYEKNKCKVEYADDPVDHLKRIKAVGAQQSTRPAAGLTTRRKLEAFSKGYGAFANEHGFPLSWQVLYALFKKD